MERALYLIEILHQTTTGIQERDRREKLYLIEILHQTTTALMLPCLVVLLYLIEILHQTTTRGGRRRAGGRVVSYRNSTSNHNEDGDTVVCRFVVSYRNSTSNHNSEGGAKKAHPFFGHNFCD